MSVDVSASAIFVESRDAGFVTRLDPRVRLAATLLFLLSLITLHSAESLAAALLIGLATAVAAQLPPRATLRRLLVIEGFLILLLISLPFTVPGKPIAHVLGFAASWEGLERALVIMVRVNAAVLVISPLLSTMGTIRLAQAMAGIGIPSKIAHLFQLTVRYISVFHEEYSRLRRAMRARAFRPGSNRHSWKTLGNLIGMLVVRSIERAERVSWAMKCRGFSGSFPNFAQRWPGPADITFSGLWIASIVGLILLEYRT